jgi:fatty acid amide hydrolase
MREPTTSLTLGAGAIAKQIASGDLSAREVVEEHIRRIEEVNPRLNAVVVPLFDRARTEAAAADATRSRGEPLGPLHGVPITIKEQFLVAGTPTTVGLPGRISHRAAVDGPLVQRLRRSGAIVLGKTNVSQLLIYHESDNPVYGRTNNPWDPGRTPGGSSGGEAAIISAGGSPLGLGGDFGGSIRIPAHFSGLHGLLPTAGRLTGLDTPAEVFGRGQETIVPQPGPLARTVEDLALAMGVLAAPGLEAIDPGVPPVPWPDWKGVPLGGLRLAAYADDGFFRPAPAVGRAVREAAEALRTLGAQVEDWTPPGVGEAMCIFLGIASADGGVGFRHTLGKNKRDRRVTGLLRAAGLPNRARPAVAGLLGRVGQRRMAGVVGSMGRRSAAGYWRLVEERADLRARFLAELDAGRYDAIVCPPHALPALPHGASEYLLGASSYSLPYNVLGMPAGVVAATRVRAGEESKRPRSRDIAERTARRTEEGSAGLPVGVQVVARHWREDVALAVMAALEEHFRAQPDYPARRQSELAV